MCFVSVLSTWYRCVGVFCECVVDMVQVCWCVSECVVDMIQVCWCV